MAFNQQQSHYFHFVITWALRVYGVLCLLITLVGTCLLVGVPLLGMANDPNWLRAENPVAVPSIVFFTALGIACLWLSRADNKTRVIALMAVTMCYLGYALLIF